MLDLAKYGKNKNILISVIFKKIRDFLDSKKSEKLFSYIQSIKLIDNNVFIKTNKPIVNNELKMFEQDLKNVILDVLNNFGIVYKDLKIIFK
ncbi:hypothetical protein KAZ01_02090 [Candidatus Gracilibacteria bacterium]|nr:hypothetical protein [Candidatus Gracilibacteria bacterium]